MLTKVRPPSRPSGPRPAPSIAPPGRRHRQIQSLPEAQPRARRRRPRPPRSSKPSPAAQALARRSSRPPDGAPFFPLKSPQEPLQARSSSARSHFARPGSTPPARRPDQLQEANTRSTAGDAPQSAQPATATSRRLREQRAVRDPPGPQIASGPRPGPAIALRAEDHAPEAQTAAHGRQSPAPGAPRQKHSPAHSPGPRPRPRPRPRQKALLKIDRNLQKLAAKRNSPATPSPSLRPLRQKSEHRLGVRWDPVDAGPSKRL